MTNEPDLPAMMNYLENRGFDTSNMIANNIDITEVYLKERENDVKKRR